MEEVNRTIERIQQMEALLDAVREAFRQRGDSVRSEPEIREKLRLLEDYMASGRWLADYELDESGGLPPDLKRGVLAQDTLYDLLYTPQTEG